MGRDCVSMQHHTPVHVLPSPFSPTLLHPTSQWHPLPLITAPLSPALQAHLFPGGRSLRQEQQLLLHFLERDLAARQRPILRHTQAAGHMAQTRRGHLNPPQDRGNPQTQTPNQLMKVLNWHCHDGTVLIVLYCGLL